MPSDLSLQSQHPPALSVVIFAYNEAENITPVLSEVRHFLETQDFASEILFVDDGSTDATAAAAAKVLQGFAHRVIRHAENRGIGAALKSGMAQSRADWVTFLPADGQIAPQALALLYAASRTEPLDVVYSLYHQRRDGWHRSLLSCGIRALIQLSQGVKVQSEGPYLCRRQLFQAAQLRSDSFFLNFEFPIRAHQAGLRHQVVHIDCRPRHSGHSKSARLPVISQVARELWQLSLRQYWRSLRQWWPGPELNAKLTEQ